MLLLLLLLPVTLALARGVCVLDSALAGPLLRGVSPPALPDAAGLSPALPAAGRARVAERGRPAPALPPAPRGLLTGVDAVEVGESPELDGEREAACAE